MSATNVNEYRTYTFEAHRRGFLVSTTVQVISPEYGWYNSDSKLVRETVSELADKLDPRTTTESESHE
jgi:ethanolamine ammonia-lyase large subunit